MSKAKWIFAWYPIETHDTERIVWLKKVYREKWEGASFYFEKPIEGDTAK